MSDAAQHCHCGREIEPRDPDPWEGRMDDYCYDCALNRCDCYPDECPVKYGPGDLAGRSDEERGPVGDKGRTPGPDAAFKPRIYSILVCPRCSSLLGFQDSGDEGMHDRALCCDHWWISPERASDRASAALRIEVAECRH